MFYRTEWETVAKVSGKTLQKLLCTNLPPGLLGVKYRVSKLKREYNYALLIACPMFGDFWIRNSFNLDDFGQGLQIIKPRKCTFTFLIQTHF